MAAARDWNLRYTLRSLRRSPAFLGLTVSTLGLAIGAVAGIWSVVDTVLLDPLPYPHADRLVVITGTAPGSDLPEEFALAPEFYLHYQEQADLLDGIAVFDSFTSTLRTDDRVERIRMSMPTATLFDTLEVHPILGRLPAAEDEDRVAVISHNLWLDLVRRRSVGDRPHLPDVGAAAHHHRRDGARVPVPRRRHAALDSGGLSPGGLRPRPLRHCRW